MSKKLYQAYSKAKFEYQLRGISWKVRSKGILDVTEDLKRNGITVKEHVYLMQTHRDNVAILIYSSLDVRTGRTRENGTDAVRVVVTVKTPQGRYYKAVKKHLRLQTLFDNLEKTLELTMKDINFNKYSPSGSLEGFQVGVGA